MNILLDWGVIEAITCVLTFEGARFYLIAQPLPDFCARGSPQKWNTDPFSVERGAVPGGKMMEILK
jgi:hypothetical protein